LYSWKFDIYRGINVTNLVATSNQSRRYKTIAVECILFNATDSGYFVYKSQINVFML